jgi:hypothetical protein
MGIAVDETAVVEALVAGLLLLAVLVPPQAVSSKAKVANNADVRAAGVFMAEQATIYRKILI